MKYDKADPCWFGYVVKLNNAPFSKDDFIKYLEDNHISTRAFFCGNITRQPCLIDRDVFYRKTDLTRTDEVMNNAFWIRVHPGINKKYMDYTKKKITTFLNQFV